MSQSFLRTKEVVTRNQIFETTQIRTGYIGAGCTATPWGDGSKRATLNIPSQIVASADLRQLAAAFTELADFFDTK